MTSPSSTNPVITAKLKDVHTYTFHPNSEEERETAYNRLVAAERAGVLDFVWDSTHKRWDITFLATQQPQQPQPKEVQEDGND